jgi:exodeoxyribonuclease V
VKGGGLFTYAEPDIMLTEVHRQARDNPIIRLSMTIRDGGRLPLGRHGESRVLSRREIDAAEVTRADQVLVGLNRTRRLYNARIREILGFRDPMPAVGEKLVCLRNDKTKGLLNGGTWTVQALRPPKGALVRLDLVPEDERRRRPVEVAVLPEFFEGREDEIPLPARRESDEFTYGYALTVHKAQGSQWNDVMLFDESYAFREHRSRWLYTAITRAAERVTVVS